MTKFYSEWTKGYIPFKSTRLLKQYFSYPSKIDCFVTEETDKNIFYSKISVDIYHYLFDKISSFQKIVNVLSLLRSVYFKAKKSTEFTTLHYKELNYSSFMSLIWRHQKLYGIPKNLKSFQPTKKNEIYFTPVSYTHLTLPTICSV